MKRIALYVLLLSTFSTNAQNVGIGITNPSEKLEVAGAIKLGMNNNAVAGTMRWNPGKNDFEGFNGKSWISLSGGKTLWGDQTSFGKENIATAFLLYEGINGGYGNYLGSAVSLSGNYLLAGAKGDFGGSYGPLTGGTVRIFRKDSSWVPRQWYSLKSPGPIASEQFGTSVSIEGNYFIVGAPGANSSKGKAYIYTFGAAFGYPEWNATLQLADEMDGDQFGSSVSLSGNYSIAGAYARDVAGKANQGRATLFQRNPATGVWAMMQHVYAPDGLADDQFGKRVSISGIYAAISAPQADINGVSNTGRVYIFQRTGNSWLMSDSITAPSNIQLNQKFGESLFMKGDTLVVGATEYSGNPSDGNGKVYIYVRNAGIWELQGIVAASDGKQSESFGNSIHFNNGLLVVGAPNAARSYHHTSGKVYVFRLHGSTWMEETILAASQPGDNDSFGSAVAISEDGVFVGASGTKVESNTFNGRVYFFFK